MTADASEVRKALEALVVQAKSDIADETARVLRDRQTSLWPVKTGFSIRGFRNAGVDDDGFTIDNHVNYAIYVEARAKNPRLPALQTVRQNLTGIVRRISGRLTNQDSGN